MSIKEDQMEREKVRLELRGMIEEARKKGLWFNSHYQDIWFSPDELERMNNEDKFLWGPVNWKLRDPNEKVQEITRRVMSLHQEREDMLERILDSMKGTNNYYIEKGR